MAAGTTRTKDPAAEPRPRPEPPPQVSCEACMRQIPSEEAYRAEAEDYVLWFCGLDCYTAWKEEAAGEKSKEVEDMSKKAEENTEEGARKDSP